MTTADSQGLPPHNRGVDWPRAKKSIQEFNGPVSEALEYFSSSMVYEEDVRKVREEQLAHALKMNRLILRDSLTQKYGRKPTDREMELNMQDYSTRAESLR